MRQANSGNRPEAILSEHVSAASQAAGEDPRVVQALEEYREAQERNETPDRRQLLERYSDVAQELSACLDALDFVQAAATKFTSPADDGRDPTKDSGVAAPHCILGDYQIIKEIGRGGMGVVYEAQQISLARRVALKMLPFAAMLDPRQLTRFKNEAQAAATLDHPHIVSVFAVGCERSVYFFAMQYVAGQTLAEVICDLRQRDGLPAGSQSHSASESYLFHGSADRHLKPTPVERARQTTAASTPTVRAQQATISTARAANSRDFFRSVARVGIQAAEALDHAHERGVLHRDVKPGNLMLDATGKLWVTDFGLARIEGNAGITMTGDLLGTLRYMSPEQALAKRVVVDHRSDIYSLGVTLYELLTLRPAFASDDRQELLRAIAFDDPAPPRACNRAIPSDLETIVLKSMAKDAGDRYATAQELADDLRRFLEDQPIRARRLGLVQQARKWSRRNRAVVTTAGSVAVCALVLGASLMWRERSRTLLALEQADANFHETQQAVNDYFTSISESTLLDVPGAEPLRQNLLSGAVNYYTKFAERNKNDPTLQAELAAAHARLAQMYAQLGSRKWVDELNSVVQIVAPLVDQGVDVSHWESFRRGALHRGFRDATINYKDSPAIFAACDRGIETWKQLLKQHPDVPGFANDLAGFQFISGTCQSIFGKHSLAIPLLEEAIENWNRLYSEDLDKSSRLYMLAMAHQFLADSLYSEGKPEAAYRSAKKAVTLFAGLSRAAERQRGYYIWISLAHMSLEDACLALGYADEALASRPNLTAYEPSAAAEIARSYYDRARSRHLNESEAAVNYQRALEVVLPLHERHPENQQYADVMIMIYGHYGQVLQREDRSHEAESVWKKAVALTPLTDEGFESRGIANDGLGHDAQALSDYNQSVEKQPNNPRHYAERARFFLRKGRHEDALADCDKGTQLIQRTGLFELVAAFEECKRAIMNGATQN